MELAKVQIQEFQELYQSHFGEPISFEEARKRGTELVKLVELLLTPDKSINQ
jgi:hypothetical protein